LQGDDRGMISTMDERTPSTGQQVLIVVNC
jgi:hypothetical protein